MNFVVNKTVFQISQKNCNGIESRNSIGLGDVVWEGDFMYGQTAYNIRKSFITFSSIRP